eukprot:scaffold193_cov255-Pinguiococcus_pyrenoidosus.AAC.41
MFMERILPCCYCKGELANMRKLNSASTQVAQLYSAALALAWYCHTITYTAADLRSFSWTESAELHTT